MLVAAAPRSRQQRQRLRGRGPGGEQHRGEQPAGNAARGGDVVGVHEHRIRREVPARQRDGVAVRHERVRAGDVQGGHVLADAGGDEHRRVGRRKAAEVPGEQLVGQLAVGKRQAEPDDVVQLGEAVHHEVAVGVLRAAELVRSRAGELPGAAVRQVGGQRPGGAPGLHVEDEVADHERLLGGHAHRRGGVQDAVGCGLGRDLVVARDDHVEVVGVQVAKPRERPSHGRAGRSA